MHLYDFLLNSNTAASSEDAAFLSKNVELCSFEYVEDFWSYWNNMPQPSRAFESIDFNLNGYALFKHGIQPNPKDPKFSSGGMYFCEANIASHHLDEFWMSLVLSLIGETLEKEEDIVGARVVDVSPDLREKLFRIELWFEVNDESAKRPALENMVSLLAGHGLKKLPLPDFSWAPISTTA